MSLPHTCVFWIKIPGNGCLWKEMRKPQHSREHSQGSSLPWQGWGWGSWGEKRLQFYCPEMDSRWKPGKVFSPRWYQTQSEAEAPNCPMLGSSSAEGLAMAPGDGWTRVSVAWKKAILNIMTFTWTAGLGGRHCN